MRELRPGQGRPLEKYMRYGYNDIVQPHGVAYSKRHCRHIISAKAERRKKLAPRAVIDNHKTFEGRAVTSEER